MKKLLICVLIIFSFVVCEDKDNSVFVDGIAAIVGEHVILKSDVAQLVNFAAAQQRLNPAVDMEKLLFLQNEVLRSIVDQKIMLEMAAVDSIEVEDKEIERALEQQIEMFVAQSGSEERAEEQLGQSLKTFRREFWYEMKDRLTTERYQQIQDAYVNHAIKQDKDIRKYLDELTTNIDKHFNWDANETDFVIKYDPAKVKPGNTGGDLSDTHNVDNNTTGALCIRVKRWAIQVPVTIDANTTQFDYNVSDVNVSCITAAH